jgi:hypothetical protein
MIPKPYKPLSTYLTKIPSKKNTLLPSLKNENEKKKELFNKLKKKTAAHPHLKSGLGRY